MKGMIFSIKKYSIHDGPGIRVSFFLKGCPLSCWWCHNPEGISPLEQEIISIKKIGDREFRTPEIAGRYYSVDELIEIAGRDRIFLQPKNGGITFSGGEPMMQTEFLIAALKAFKAEGYHTAVDTSGYSSPEKFRAVSQFTDLFLFDLKHLDDEKHLEYTGVSNICIIENLKLLVKNGKDVILRIPLIPGKNDSGEHLEDMRDLVNSIKAPNLKGINLLPFHRIGASKYERLNLQWRMADTVTPSRERLKEIAGFFSETSLKVKTGG